MLTEKTIIHLGQRKCRSRLNNIMYELRLAQNSRAAPAFAGPLFYQPFGSVVGVSECSGGKSFCALRRSAPPAAAPFRLRRNLLPASTHRPRRRNRDGEARADAKRPLSGSHRGFAPTKNYNLDQTSSDEYFSLISSTLPQLNLPSGHLPETKQLGP